MKMTDRTGTEWVSRRKAVSLLGLLAAAGLGPLTASDVEAETVGMERRQGRRTGRHTRRHERRTGTAPAAKPAEATPAK